jgi:hypothetical protein
MPNLLQPVPYPSPVHFLHSSALVCWIPLLLWLLWLQVVT